MEIREKISEWLVQAKKLVQKTFLLGKEYFGRERSSRGLAALFILAVFVGVVTKSLLHDSLTIGFDDYKLSRSEKIIDLNQLQKELIRNGGSLAAPETVPRGEVCAEEEK